MVVGRIYGMKYSWKGHKDRNRYKNRIKRSGQARLVYVTDINRNIATAWRWPHDTTTWTITTIMIIIMILVIMTITTTTIIINWRHKAPYIHFHPSLNRGGRWGTTDDFTPGFLHFSPFSTGLLDLPNSKPVHSLMLSSHLFLCLPCLLFPFTVPCKMVLTGPMDGKHVHTTAVCVSLRWSRGRRVVRLRAIKSVIC